VRSAAASLTLFDNWAAHYDESVGRPGDILEGYGESLREAAAMLSLPAGAEVLDVGIGTGGFAALLAEGGARVSGVDISPKMLERCQAAHPAFSLSLGSFLPIPYVDGRFDAVIASFAFHEVPPRSGLMPAGSWPGY
jgi:putative AdoMet-dependent methyltransferase